MLPGGATVPGRALIDTLPLVWQTLLKSVLWQVGRATAAGAVTPAATARPASTSAVLPRVVISLSPFGLLPETTMVGVIAQLLRGRPR